MALGISSGGVDVINLVPSIATAKFDIRIAPHQDPEEILNELDTWCQEASASGLPLGKKRTIDLPRRI